mgnify:CR=1 FL=1
MLTAIKYRIYPNKEQRIQIDKTIGCARKMYNLLLADYNKTFTLNRVSSYKTEYEYLKEVDSLALANSSQNLLQAWKNYYNNKEHFEKPTFKRKNRSKQTYTTNNQNGTIKIEKGKIKLPKFKTLIKIKLHRLPNGKIKKATIEKTSIGTYTVSILFDVPDKPKKVKLNKDNIIGIDLGLTHFTITNDGFKYDNHKYFSKMKKKLAKAQQKLSRIYESNVKSKTYDDESKLINIQYEKPLSEHTKYQKQRLKVAKIHYKIKNQRLDRLHKISSEIIKNHDYIILESLNIKNLIENTELTQYITDVSWRTFINMLIYKAERYGKQVIQIDKYFPSTKRCSTCGVVGDDKPLNIRKWTCTCGVTHDRDINAAINIKNEGLKYIL